jgi:Aerotolerance regulator N-terminal
VGALSPVFLAAAVAVGVPIFIHLFQRHETRRFSFPALRYLQRTERDHARQIKLRQLILLLVRVAVLLLIVGAGARLIFNGRGTAHPPTAVVIVIDNSMSSGLVVGETRVLDRLKAIATASLDEASDEDRIWVLRAGEPWLPALPGDATEARSAIEATRPTDARGALGDAITRAVGLLAASEFEHREIHLLSDLQESAFSRTQESIAGTTPIVVWSFEEDLPENNGLASVVVGGGLPPLEGQRSEVTIAALDGTSDSLRLPVRLVINERIRGAATVPVGSATSVSLPPAGAGWIRGYADSDPDALRADDRRYFAFRSRPPPVVATTGSPGLFAEQALSVLEQAGRISTATVTGAELLVSSEGMGLESLPASGSVLIVPSADPTRLPALNRRLSDAGIPWRIDVRADSGEADVTGRGLPASLEGVRAKRWYRLRHVAESENASTALAEAGGNPWIVQGRDGLGRRYLLLASPLDQASSSLPVSSSMLQFLDWAASDWAGMGGTKVDYVVGDHISAPRGATHVRLPGGAEVEIDGTRMVRGTAQAGFYTFLEAGEEVSVVALNVPALESLLERVEPGDLDTKLGSDVTTVDREDRWVRSIFRARQGPELWWPLLLAAALLLLVEALVAASGRLERAATGSRRRTPATSVDAAA